MALFAVPISLKQANDFIEQFHRHNKRTSNDGGKFAIGCSEGLLVGVAIVGRPIARVLDDGWTAEVLRTCSSPDAPKNVNSFLYGCCWRAWRAMGGRKLITYTLASESGVSLKASGWQCIAKVKPGDWNREKAGRFREYQPIYGQEKLRWEITNA